MKNKIEKNEKQQIYKKKRLKKIKKIIIKPTKWVKGHKKPKLKIKIHHH